MFTIFMLPTLKYFDLDKIFILADIQLIFVLSKCISIIQGYPKKVAFKNLAAHSVKGTKNKRNQ